MSSEKETYIIEVDRDELNLIMTGLLALKIRKRAMIREIRKMDDEDEFNHSGLPEDEKERGIIAVERGLNSVIRLRNKLSNYIKR